MNATRDAALVVLVVALGAQVAAAILKRRWPAAETLRIVAAVVLRAALGALFVLSAIRVGERGGIFVALAIGLGVLALGAFGIAALLVVGAVRGWPRDAS